jgi:hypothetical protein
MEPGKLILLCKYLLDNLQSATEATTIETMREKLTAAIGQAEFINQSACEAQNAVDSPLSP